MKAAEPNTLAPNKQVVINFASVLTDSTTNQKSLHSNQKFSVADVMIQFKVGSVVASPNYLTVQIEAQKHFIFEPCYLQYLNHSCNPNVFVDTNTHQLIALQNIEVGDELTYFYPSTEWAMAQPFTCNCGNKNCLQVIQGAAYLPVSILKQYRLSTFIQQMLGSAKECQLPANLKVIVLAPLIETNDENLDYYYDFSQSIAEYTKVFNQLSVQWSWQPVTLKNYQQTIKHVVADCEQQKQQPFFFNLCDGDELNNTPGISVIKYLDELQLNYSGSNEYFYNITTSKQKMKQAFDEHQVANAAWQFIESMNDIDEKIFEKIGTPIIVKPAVSGGSMGVGIKNVVHNIVELQEQVAKILAGYRGWNLNAGGIIAEQYISGAEFTVLITGNYDNSETAKIYMPVERIFHHSLPEEEKFLSFDRYWEIYETETEMPKQENFYEYALPDKSLIEAIKQISWDGYVACKGKGYTRADVRMDKATKKLYVLEVNAQCGLSEDENYTSIGAILKFSNVSFTSLVANIIENSLKKS